MHTGTGILAVVASVSMMLALVLAWGLFVFFLVFEHLRLTPPTPIVVAMSLG